MVKLAVVVLLVRARVCELYPNSIFPCGNQEFLYYPDLGYWHLPDKHYLQLPEYEIAGD